MRLGVEKSKKVMAYLFIIPAVLYMFVFCIYPIGYNLILSFQDMQLSNMVAGTYQFVGMDQYKELFMGESAKLFMIGMKNTFIYTFFSILFQFTIGFAFAMFLQKNLEQQNF